ncbi:ABC transporter ATP-binding protein [Polymorphum gilvum]|uniref:ABC sulfonate transporter, ATPase subunit n=1 Tax=Polymorphum gilvum (strain LMG 25793 / CGMCC 1.9160 / SL003B-26A1) TaxID=991905 RepID=F2IXU8_POLGS|nr:ATP-binding cassette domain-containing protein [Polymorphum gilvum]ADZ69429.1 ABC sulfonate transporter, ATPase subunit [Polymorphum gilvum SL003B-26A1]
MRIDIAGKSFGSVSVLGRIELDIASGERIALLGPSGIGKSTLIRMVAGLDRDFAGRIEDVGRTAIVFQEPTLLPWRSAVQNVTLATRCSASDARALLAEVGLEGREDAFPRQLSLGQQRRLALARAFAAKPAILLLDEAFASLDPETADRMHALTEQMIRTHGTGAILATHDLDEALRLGSRLIVLSGRPATVKLDLSLAGVRDDTGRRDEIAERLKVLYQA